MAARNDISRFTQALLRTFNSATNTVQMRALGQQAIKKIVRRTRLGYGVDEKGDKKFKLEPLRPMTIANRLRNKRRLHGQTRPKRSNLTFTGQMLNSMKVKRASHGVVAVGPKGSRREGGITNPDLAELHANGTTRMKPRPFNNLSRLERRQLVRWYRKRFGDLVKRNKKL